MEKEKLIQKYLHAELTDAEFAEFEKLLETDQEFADEVELRSIYYAERSSKLKAELVASLEDERSNVISISEAKDRGQNEQRRSVRPIYMLSRIAAVLVIGVMIFGIYRSMNPIQSVDLLADSYLLERHEAPATIRGDSDVPKELINSALTTYSLGDYDEASVHFNKILEISDHNLDIQFYLGLCYLYKDPPDYGKAVRQFDLILSVEGFMSEEAKWYSSVAYVKLGDFSNAKKMLDQIVREQTWQHEKAKKLLNKL